MDAHDSERPMMPAPSPGGRGNYELSARELFGLVARFWRPALVAGILIGAASFGASFLLRPVYSAHVLLQYVGDPTKQMPQQSGLGGLGGLAAIAGVNIGSENNPKESAIATLGSHSFVREFIAVNGLMPLLAPDEWPVSDPAKAEEIEWRRVERFRNKVMRITEDPKTGSVTVHVDWRDPKVAADWATKVVQLINQRLKETAVNDANRSLAHLKAQLDAATNAELKRAVASVTERQIEALMYADIRDEFAFRTVDVATAPPVNAYVFPNRVLFLGLGFLGGCVVGLFLAMSYAILKARRRLNQRA